MRDIYLENILQEWKKEAKITHLMLYKLRAGVLTIYTDKPGPLIGLRGERIYRYQDRIKALPYCGIKEVKLEETDGIF